MTTAERILNTAERDGYLEGMEKSAGYIMSAAKEIASKYDMLAPEEQKVMRNTYYKMFLKQINKKPRYDLSEMSGTGGGAGAGGATVTAGNGEQYSTPKAFDKKKKMVVKKSMKLSEILREINGNQRKHS